VEACLRETGDDYFAAVREEYRHRRDTLVAGLGSIPGVRVPKIDGAFYALVELPVADTDAFCEWIVTEFSHEGETVLMAPASGFYLTPGRGKREVRLAYVLDSARLTRAVECLRAALIAYPGAR
jgi:aspartate aminotransferase